jgi:hypothetical protein
LSSQKEKKKKSIEDKEQLLIFSKKINNSLFSLTTMKAARMIKQKSAKHVKIFNSSIKMMRDEEVKLFKKNDFVTFVQALRTFFKVKVYTIYKRKNQKIKFNDICVFDDFKSNDDVS